ncbi:MAG: C25 family cysteine peptidase [bacterium]
MMRFIKLFTLIYVLTNICYGQTGARYLIITHDDYYDALKPLANWKTQKGVKAKIVKLSEIGSDSTQIRSYVINAYNSWQVKPEFLLLVGNPDQVPFPRYDYQGNIGNTDNYYTNVIGDFHNEIMPGRFWVYDTIEAQTIVNKVFSYDESPNTAIQSWFKKGVTVVNEDQDSFPADSVYYADARYMHSLMNNAGFVHIDSFSEYAGHDSSHVINAINNGRSYILYRGVGWGFWDWPFWGIYPYLMHNSTKLPIVISATCATVHGIGYSWLSAGTPEQPKGCVGFFGTTTGLYHAAELRSALARGTLASIFTDSLSTLGKAAEAGRLNYYAIFENTLEYDSWTCLGDPEMTVRTTMPRHIDVDHDSVLWISASSGRVGVSVQHNELPVENILVCVMSKQDTSVYNYGRTDNFGKIQFVDTFNIPGDSIYITVTGRNINPYTNVIRVNFSGAPYVLLNSFALLDTPGGNNDSIANPGEDIEIPVWVKNWGDSTGYNVVGILQDIIPDSFITLYDTIKYFGDIGAFDSAYTSSNGYNAIIAPNCPDSHQVGLRLLLTDTNDSSWISDFNFTVHAPILQYWDHHFPGSLKYTGIGDINQLIVDIENIGSYSAENIIGKIFSDDSFFIAIDSISSFGTIYSNSTGSNQADPFVIATMPSTPPCYSINVMVEITAGVYIDTMGFAIYAGQKDYLIWDKDASNSSGLIIKAVLDSLNFYGDYTDTLPVNDFLSLYKSLFICLGTYPNNHVITDTSQDSQEIERYLSILGGKVYMEGGDVWYADPHYNHGYQFHALFSLLPISNSVGPLSSVTGKDSTFTRSMLFNYPGGSNSIDRIDADSPGIQIFEKTQNGFGCGVAANQRTVGVSFNLGGLEDGSAPSTKRILIDSIMVYFGILPTGIHKYDERINSPGIIFSIYPNPSRKNTNIKFQIPNKFQNPNVQIPITLKIFDVSGRLTKNLKLSTAHSPLPTLVSWDGTDENGRRVANGIYFISCEINNRKMVKKAVLIK